MDAARLLALAGARITLLHVTPAEVAEAAHDAYLGLFGRGAPGRDPGPRVAELAAASAGELLDAAAGRLGRPAAGSNAMVTPNGKWSAQQPARTCSSWPEMATGPGSDPGASARPPGSSSTTPPARSCWSPPPRPPGRPPHRP